MSSLDKYLFMNITMCQEKLFTNLATVKRKLNYDFQSMHVKLTTICQSNSVHAASTANLNRTILTIFCFSFLITSHLINCIYLHSFVDIVANQRGLHIAPFDTLNGIIMLRITRSCNRYVLRSIMHKYVVNLVNKLYL